MGVLSIAYTVLGGIEAVIWTDVIQVFVLLGGALLSLVMILGQIDGGFGSVMQVARYADKLFMLDTRLNFMAPTLWVVLLGGICSTLISYGSDQFSQIIGLFAGGLGGLISCLVLGYVVSLLTHSSSRDTTGLTIWSVNEEIDTS